MTTKLVYDIYHGEDFGLSRQEGHQPGVEA